uniref:ZM domain-containing protein n=1 Tax=Caenorhabditis tropicalis TaxID=1561998 RepID=A0A1I7TV15_9PELO
MQKVQFQFQNEELSPQPNAFSNEDARFTKNLDNSMGNNRERFSNGGRFVKKSAAALIAKKQGMQSEDPVTFVSGTLIILFLFQNSATEIIDPRIAEEIKNLRDREEELKRSRSELALITSPPPSSYQMSPKKTSPNSNMRSAQSYDHLDNSIRSPIERSHSSHNVYHMKNGMNGDSSPYHLGGSYGNANYGSMPRAQHRKDVSYHPQTNENRAHDPGYRQSRNGEFFRQTPATSETANAGWQKSP